MAPCVAMASEQPLCPQVGVHVGEVKGGPEAGLGEQCDPCHQEVMDSYGCANTVTSMTYEHSSDSLSSEEPFCRICHEGGAAGELLCPCECAGTVAMVHRGCLEHWLTASNSSHCELCRHQYALDRLPKPFTEWLGSPSMQHQRRTLCGDVVCFLFITPLASLSGWLCVQGAMDLYSSNNVQAVGLIVLTLALFTIYFFWTVVSLRYHLHLFQTWKQTNQRVKLHVPRPARIKHSHQTLFLNFLSKDTSKETVV